MVISLNPVCPALTGKLNHHTKYSILTTGHPVSLDMNQDNNPLDGKPRYCLVANLFGMRKPE